MTKYEIKQVIEDAIEEKMQQYWVDRETHYRQHDFIDRLMSWSDTISNSFLRAIATALTMAIIGLILLGFILWGRNHF